MTSVRQWATAALSVRPLHNGVGNDGFAYTYIFKPELYGTGIVHTMSRRQQADSRDLL